MGYDPILQMEKLSRVYVVCPGLVSDISVFGLMNFCHCFPHFENQRGEKTNSVPYSFLGGVEN